MEKLGKYIVLAKCMKTLEQKGDIFRKLDAS